MIRVNEPIMFRLIVACILLFSGSNVQAQEVTKILFIGNSLTYENNLPELVEEEAATRGLEVKTRMIALLSIIGRKVKFRN